jgi:hypothetical protein
MIVRRGVHHCASLQLAAFALRHKIAPRGVRSDRTRLADFQNNLRGLGVMLEWPSFDALTPRTRTGYVAGPEVTTKSAPQD